MDALRRQFRALFGHEAEGISSAAGRVNLIGEHVDYCGGEVLPAALSLRCRVAYRRNGEGVLRLAATDLSALGVVPVELARTGEYRGLPWGNYQAGVAHVLREAGYPLAGCDLLYECSVPFGAGLSSSAAIEVATAHVLRKTGGASFTDTELAVLCRRAENEYCGVNCGIMDQFISANGRAGCAVLLDCSSLRYSYVPLRLGDCALVLADTGKAHSLGTSKYNERRAETEEALSLLRKRLNRNALAELSSEELQANRDLLPPVVYRRARHVVTECARVRASVEALERGDLAAFGALLSASHRSLREDYEVTGPELDALAAAAWAQRDCLGSRMTGAGFGGCTVSLVRREGAERFEEEVGAAYARETGRSAKFYRAEIADGIIDE